MGATARAPDRPWAPGVERYLPDDESRPAYEQLARWAATDLQSLDYEGATRAYAAFLKAHGYDDRALAILGLSDRYFLLTALIGRDDALHPWLYARCREVEAAPDGYLDLWAREHYKSTIITFAGCIQEVLRDPEISIGIFSYKKGNAADFLGQIKGEFEKNDCLKRLYSDVLWRDAKREAPKWAEDEIVVKRQGNPKEQTIEAHGLVSGMPTGRHFVLRVYDDVVTPEAVTNPEMVKRVDEAIQQSDNLGAGDEGRAWFIGTRYHMADPYKNQIDRGSVIPRVYPATDDGTVNGKPVLISAKRLKEKLRDQPATFGAQMLQNPAAGREMAFNLRHFAAYAARPRMLNVYILVDPSAGKKDNSDRTAIAVIGIGPDGKKYLLDGYRHRMPLSERWERMRDLRRHWMRQRGVQNVYVGYERYGMQTDVEHFETMMSLEGKRFTITELNRVAGGNAEQAKIARIKRLEPDIVAGQFVLPCVAWNANLQGPALWWVDESGQLHWEPDDEQWRRGQVVDLLPGEDWRLVAPLRRRDEANNDYDLLVDFFEEVQFFPYAPHEDFLDACNRIYDMEPSPPQPAGAGGYVPPTYVDGA